MWEDHGTQVQVDKNKRFRLAEVHADGSGIYVESVYKVPNRMWEKGRHSRYYISVQTKLKENTRKRTF